MRGLFAGILALIAVGAAAGLGGAVLPEYGGPILGVGSVLALVAVGEKGYSLSKKTYIAVGLLAGLIVLQCLPSPPLVHHLLAPGQAVLRDRVSPEWEGSFEDWQDAISRYDVLAAVGVAEDWNYDILLGAQAIAAHPLAIRMEGVAWPVVQLIAIPAFFLLGARLSRSYWGTRVWFVGILLVGVVEAVLGLLWRNGPTIGISAKVAYLGSATGTFTNRSHFGAFLCLALGAAWGLAASLFPLIPEEVARHARRHKRSSQPPSVFEVAGDKIPRLVLLSFLSAIIAVGLVMSQGRGPLIGLFVGGTLTGLWLWRSKKEQTHLAFAVVIPLGGILLASLAFGIRGSIGRFMNALSQDDSVVSRIEVWRESLGAWKDSPLIGYGPGGFGLAWALHHPSALLYDFAYAHSEPLQILVEYGLVGLAIIGFLFFQWLWALRRLPEAGAYAIGAWVGCSAVVLQSLADFPLHIPGVFLPFLLMAGYAWGACQPAPQPTRPFAWGALALLGAILGLYVAKVDADFPGNREQRLGSVPVIYYQAMQNPSAAREWLPEAQAKAHQMPLNPWAWLTVGLGESLLGRHEQPELHAFNADSAVARALVLRPKDPRLLLAAADVLIRVGRSTPSKDAWQTRATMLLKEAVALDGWRAEEAFAVGHILSLDNLAKIADVDSERASWRVRYAYALTLQERGQYEAALAACQQVITAEPAFGSAAFRAAEISMRMGNKAQALQYYKQFLDAKERPIAMEGWAWLQLGELEQASSRFRQAVKEDNRNRWAWQGMVEVAHRREDNRAEISALEHLLKLDPSNAAIVERLSTLREK